KRSETPLFENMLAVRAVDAEEEVQVSHQDDVVQKHVIEEIATEVVPPTPTSPSPSSPVGTSQRIKSSDDVEKVFNQGRITVDMKTNEGIDLEVDQEKSDEEDTKVQEAVEVVTTAKLITEVVTAATEVATASTPILAAKPAAKPKVLKIAAAALAVSTRKRKGVAIRDPDEELHIDTPAETPIVKDKRKGILIKDPKPMKKKDQIEIDAEYAKKLQEELEKEHEEAYKQIDWNAAFDHV
nr:hypothetical protein [Tanacetum cinerariifolium]